MTVLVDEPVWAWRGRRWAHLVSDESHNELHQFASRLGYRRMSFQGDHYDVEEHDRSRAIDQGAVAVESRVLVERLVRAGLRRRHDKPTWHELLRSDEGERVDHGAAMVDHADDEPRVRQLVVELGGAAEAGRAGLYVDHRRFVLLIDAPPAVRLDEVMPAEADEIWLSGPRADGWRSFEAFVNRKSPSEG